MDQDIRDKSGRLMARIKTIGNKSEIRSHTGQLLGFYLHDSNQTKTSTGQLVGYGNLLTTLIR